VNSEIITKEVSLEWQVSFLQRDCRSSDKNLYIVGTVGDLCFEPNLIVTPVVLESILNAKLCLIRHTYFICVRHVEGGTSS
jgi:hypothetical protein